jgi:hypothetical protein
MRQCALVLLIADLPSFATGSKGIAMGEIVQFSDLGVRDWKIIEASLRDALQSIGLSADAIEWICNDLKPRYFAGTDNLSFSISAPTECRAAVQETANQLIVFFHKATTQMMLEMAKLEVELYLAKSGNSAL